MRKLGWLVAAAISLGLAWWGWHLPPAPHCELEGSQGCEVIGYSADGKWFAARSPADESNERPRWTYLWNARTGEKVQSLPPSYMVSPSVQSHELHRATWHTIDLPGQHYGTRYSTFEYTDNGLALLPMEQPIAFWPLLKDGDTFVWMDDERRLWRFSRHTNVTTLAGQIPQHWYWKNVAGQGRVLVCRVLRGAEVCLWDIQRGSLPAEYDHVDAISISDDGGFAAIADSGGIDIWNLHELSKDRIELPTFVGWEFDDLEINDALLISRNGRRFIAPICGSLQDFYVVDVAEPPRIRRMHLPEPVAQWSQNRSWWFDATGDYVFVTNESGEKTCWHLGGDHPRMIARLNWSGIRLAATPELIANNGWTVGPNARRTGDALTQGGCIFGAPSTAFLGGTGVRGALGFTGGTMQTGLGFGGDFRPTFSSDSRWLVQSHSTFHDPPGYVQWFGRYFPLDLNRTFGYEAELVNLSEWKILGAWADVESTWFSPEGKFIAVQLRDGPVSIWELPPKQRWFLPLLLQVPLLGVLWHCRPRCFRRNSW